MKNRNVFGKYFLFSITVQSVLFWTFCSFASSGITYHGRLLKPDSTPVTSSSVQFRMQIRTPGAEDCLLYEEIQTLDLSTTAGMFALSLNDGSGVRQDSHHTWTLFEALANREDFTFTPGDCTGINSYSPAPVDNRKFRVFFNDGSFSGWEALPIQTINYIPMAIESYAVGGFPASALLRVEDAGTLGTPSALTTTQYNEILALVAGTSSQYEQDGELNGSALPTISSGESVRWTGSAWQSFTPLTSETDPNVEAFAKSSLPTCATGEVLKSDGTTLSCVTDSGGWSAVDATATVKGIVNVPATGGLEVSSGAIGLPDVVTASTYTKVTVDAKGRVTTGANITGSDITSGTIGGSTSVSTTGSVSSASLSTRQIDLYDSDNTHHISLLTPATTDLTSNYDLVFPNTLGSANQVLGMNAAGDALENKSITAGSGVTITHSAGGIAIAATGSGGTVTSVTGTSPISVATGTTTPVISLDDAGTAGTYGSATEVPVFTTDAKGRVTSVTETTISGVSPVGSTLATGQAWVGDGSGEAQARFIGFSDLKTSIAGNANQIPTTCSSSQVMTYSAVTDVFSCTSISITASQVSDLSTELSDYVEVAGDTMTGALNLPSNGLVVGTNELVVSGGKVGIGTTNPSSPLHVYSSTNGFIQSKFENANAGASAVVAVSAATDAGMMNFGMRSTAAGAYGYLSTDGASGMSLQATNASGPIIFQTGGFSEKMRVTSSGNVGIGTTTPSSKLDVSGTIQIANGGETCGAAADGGMIRYNGGDLQFCNESSWQTLGVSGAGLTSLNGQTGSTQTFATPGTTGLAPNWSSASDAHTLNIPMASGAGVTAGLLSKTDYDSFAAKQSSTLTDGSILIGNSSNVATTRAISGDATLSNTGVLTLKNTGTAGTYAKVTTDAQGRVTSGSSLTASDLPDEVILDGGNTTGAAVVVGTNDAQSFQLETNNSPAMTILSGGNVGIGTTTPSDRLTVKAVTNNTNDYPIQMHNSADSMRTGHGTYGMSNKIGTAQNINYTFDIGGNAIFNTGGDVGIGTSTPGINGYGGTPVILHVHNEGATSTSYSMLDLSTSSVADTAYSGVIQFGTMGSADTNKRSALIVSRLVGDNSTDVSGNLSFLTTDLGSTQERIRIQPSGSVGIGTTDPSTKLDIVGTIQIANGGETCSVAADGGMIRYSGGNLQFCNESAWQTLGVSGAGLTSLNGQTGSTQTFATPGTSGTAPNWSSSSNAHTLNIPMASTASVTAGLISKTDYDAFNAKLDSVAGETLSSGQVWVGDGSNVAAQRYFGVEDLKTALGAMQIPTACTSKQTMIWSAVTDVFSCTDISITASQVSDLDLTDYVEIAGDTMTGALNLPSNGLAVGTNELVVSGGKVGIGTTSPSHNLHVSGSNPSISLYETGSSTDLNFWGVSSGLYLRKGFTTYYTFNTSGAGFGLGTSPISGNNLTLPANSRIGSARGGSGNYMGITANGATSGATNLDGGKLALSSGLSTGSGTSKIEFLTATAGASGTADNTPSVKMTILGSGNVGIGTASPAYPLSVESITSNPTVDWWNVGAYSYVSTSGSSASYSGNAAFNGFAVSSATGAGLAQARIFSGSARATNDASAQYVYGNYTALETHNLDSGYGLYVRTEDTGSSTGGTQYGVYLNMIDTDVTSYGIYQNGSSLNYFAGNVGIGTNNPQTKLEVAGTIKATSFEGPLTATTSSIGDGSAASPSMTFTNDSNTGFYSSGADSIGISAGGSQVWNITTSSIVSPTVGGGSMSSSNGTASAPTFSFAGDLDTGWFRPAADTLAASTGGTERVRISSNGSVGIGTTSPSNALHVHRGGTSESTMRFSTSDITGSGGAYVGLGHSTGSALYANRAYLLAGSETLGLTLASAENINFYSGNPSSLAMTIDETGQVGIGTTTPGRRLEVQGNTGIIRAADSNNTTAEIAAAAYLEFQATDGRMGWIGDGSSTSNDISMVSDLGGINLVTGGTTRLAVESSGNVGIGTTGPNYQVHQQSTAASSHAIQSTTGGMSASLLLDRKDNSTAGSSAYVGFSTNGPGTPTFQMGMTSSGTADNNLYFGNNNFATKYMTLTTGGNVGIGTTDPYSVLHIKDPLITAGAPATSGTTDPSVLMRVEAVTGVLDTGMDTDGTIWIQPRDKVNLATNRDLALNANGGNVGIGTISPQAKLEVRGGAVIGAGVGAKTIGVVSYMTYTNSTTTYIHIKTPFRPAINSDMYYFKVEGHSYNDAKDIDLTYVGYSYTSNPTIVTNGNSRDPQGIYSPAQYVGSDGYIYLRFKPTNTYYLTIRVDSMYVGNGRIVYPGEMTVTESTALTL